MDGWPKLQYRGESRVALMAPGSLPESVDLLDFMRAGLSGAEPS